MQVLCIGSAVIDITARNINKDKDWCEKQRIESIKLSPGGDAVNQCVRMADVGINAGIVSAVGNDKNGELLCHELKLRNVNTDHLIVKHELPTGMSLVLLNEKGDRTTFSVKGAYCELEKADVKDILSKDIKALSIAGLFTEPRLEKDGGLLELLKSAKEKNILVFADLASDKLGLGLSGIEQFLPYVDYFLPSLFDAEKMNGSRGAFKNAAVYRECGCKNVIMKCGADGCFILSDEFTGNIEAKRVEPVDTTGAGDCMVALFIAEILRGKNIKQACRAAAKGATMSIMYHGACSGKIRLEDIE